MNMSISCKEMSDSNLFYLLIKFMNWIQLHLQYCQSMSILYIPIHTSNKRQEAPKTNTYAHAQKCEEKEEKMLLIYFRF